MIPEVSQLATVMYELLGRPPLRLRSGHPHLLSRDGVSSSSIPTTNNDTESFVNLEKAPEIQMVKVLPAVKEGYTLPLWQLKVITALKMGICRSVPVPTCYSAATRTACSQAR